jgi:hypothetical protein
MVLKSSIKALLGIAVIFNGRVDRAAGEYLVADLADHFEGSAR